MDGTHTGKFGAESVRAALRRVRGSAPNFVPRGIPGGRNFCPAHAGRNGFPLERVAFATRCLPRTRTNVRGSFMPSWFYRGCGDGSVPLVIAVIPIVIVTVVPIVVVTIVPIVVVAVVPVVAVAA